MDGRGFHVNFTLFLCKDQGEQRFVSGKFEVAYIMLNGGERTQAKLTWLTTTCLSTKKKTEENTVKLINVITKINAHKGHLLFSLGSERGTRAR